jgi:CheY-like chemotaxis protein
MADRETSAPAGVAGALHAGPAPALRVLIVEDNADAAETLADLLQLSGHDTRIAGDGSAALAAAAEMRPEVVICDIGLPDMTGHEVMRALRARAGAPRPFAIALSGYAQPEDKRRALDAGFDAHLAKPPRIDELERLLASAKGG